MPPRNKTDHTGTLRPQSLPEVVVSSTSTSRASWLSAPIQMACSCRRALAIDVGFGSDLAVGASPHHVRLSSNADCPDRQARVALIHLKAVGVQGSGTGRVTRLKRAAWQSTGWRGKVATRSLSASCTNAIMKFGTVGATRRKCPFSANLAFTTPSASPIAETRMCYAAR